MNKPFTLAETVTPIVGEMREALQQIAANPADAPQGLSGIYYTDPAYFEYEKATVLKRGWHCVGRADEVPNQGDYFTINLLGEPVIIVRSQSGIRALSNVCKHRGMRLAEGTGNVKRFVCSYHAWMYETDGNLLRAPRMKNEGFDPKNCRLGEFYSVERFGFVYVSLSESPNDIDTELTGLGELIGNYEPEKYCIAHCASEVWHTNWKCLVENFMEGYHLSVVHPQTLHGYTPTGLSRKGPSGSGFTSYLANYPEDIPSRGKGSTTLTPEERHRSSLYSVFPCQVASIAATLLVSLSILPLTAESIEVRWTLSVYDNELDAETIAQRVALWEEVNREDREKLEAMQTSLRSIHATGGPLAEADYEGTIHDFLLWLAKQDA
ncbi:MAG: aromatic ring-hydroxylating dioxygenase subunit alpha [Pseudomonadota bacterium]